MSKSSRWPEVKEIVQGALALSPEGRAAYLEDQCGDDAELRQEAEAFLAISSTEADFFDNYTIVPPSMETLTLTEGDELGPYRIIRELGRGGMGAVYLAEDREHRRHVALKTVPRHSQNALLHEKRLLASLRHPNIAILFDSGQTEAGLGYFIMEYVEGEPITSYCEQLKLSLRQRLELFLSVCDAVAYAHRNLVVHRDLKPKNILVTADKEVKLLDFGIAKLLPADQTFTPSEARAFTVAFASPEQLVGERTTTATDIYSLGVLLCLLLTGRLPYPVKSAADLPWAVRNLEPEKPSVLAGKEDSALTADGLPISSRNLGPWSNARELHGDLDAIVLKALQKDPDLRFESVQQFADDVRSFLSHRPVAARRPALQYRFTKFLRRHAIESLISLLVLIIAILVAAAFIFQYQEIRRQRDAALRQEQRAREVTAFLKESFAASDPWERIDAQSITARQLVDSAALRLETRLADQPLLRADLLRALGEVYTSLGLFNKATATLTNANQILESTQNNTDLERASTLSSLADLYHAMGAYKEGISAITDSLKLSTRHLSADNPLVIKRLLTLASLQHGKGKYSSAEQNYHRVLTLLHEQPRSLDATLVEAMHNFAMLYRDRGDNVTAERMLREILRLGEDLLGVDHPLNTWSMETLAATLREKGKREEAGKLLENCLRIRRAAFGENHPATAHTLKHYALLLEDNGNPLEAERAFRRVLSIENAFYQGDHPDIAVTLNNLGSLARDRGDLEEAARLYRHGLEMWTRHLGEENPDILVYFNNLAMVYQSMKRYKEAEMLLMKALAIAKRPGVENIEATIRIERNIAIGRNALGDFSEARSHSEHALSLAKKHLPADHPLIPMTRYILAYSLMHLREYQHSEELLLDSYNRLKSDTGRSARYTKKVLAYLVKLYQLSGDPEKASRYERLLQSTSETND